MPEVSVIIPNYNYGAFLGEAIDSVLSQTFADFEVHIVDNYSQDESYEVFESRKDRRLNFHLLENKGLIANARNFGIAVSTGKYLAFLDSDDSWHPNKLAIQVDEMQKGWFASYHDLRMVKVGLPGTVRGFNLGNKPLQKMLTSGNPIPLSSVMCEADKLREVGNFRSDANLVGVEDFALWLEAAQMGHEFKYIRMTLGTYRVHSSTSKNIDSAERTRSLVEGFYGSLNPKETRRAHGFINYANARQAHFNRDSSRERKLLMAAILSGNKRFIWRSLIRLLLIPLRQRG